MEKNQRNPRKRLNSLILLVAFTAVMLIVSTYAWFTSQKTVTVGNLEGKVNVAEGIEISLDAKNWSQEIDFSKYANATAGVGQYTGLTQLYGEKVHNNTPTELIPVSTTGTETATNGTTNGNEVAFFNGAAAANSANGSTKLSKIVAVDPIETTSSEADFAGYYAIDLFLRNSSKLSLGADGKAGGEGENADEVQGQAMETLQLNTNSNLQLVTGGNTSTGLQNTARVALALYTPSSTADVAISQEGTAEQIQAKIIAATTGEGKAIKDVAIWEPNADQHVSEIVTNNNKIKWTTADAALYLTTGVNVDDDEDLETGADRLVSGAGKFLANEIVPTYGLLAASVNKEIADVYDWDGSESTNLKKQIALQTKKSAGDYTTVDGGVRNLISSTTSAATGKYEWGVETEVVGGKPVETGAKEFKIYKNQISRVRMYIWLDGQDVDCTNYASHGAGLHIDLGLVKGAIPGKLADS